MAAPTRRVAYQNPYHRDRSMPSRRPPAPPPPGYFDYLMAEDRYYHRYYAAMAQSQGHHQQPAPLSPYGTVMNTSYYQPQQRPLPSPAPSVPMCHHITTKQRPAKPKHEPVVYPPSARISCQSAQTFKLDPEMPSLERMPLPPTRKEPLADAQQRCQPGQHVVKEPKFSITLKNTLITYLKLNNIYLILQLSLWQTNTMLNKHTFTCSLNRSFNRRKW